MFCRLCAMFLLLLPGAVRAASPGDDLRPLLERLRANALWCEVVFADGRVRTLQVDSLSRDSVVVREVIGALQERRAAYALSEFSQVREVGERRIPLRRPLYQPRRSLGIAMALETAIPVPGAGYLYIGKVRQGMALIGLAAAIAGTGFATGESGAAGWVPMVAWVKVASLLHLWDEVRAMNQAAAAGDGGHGPETVVRPGEYLRGPGVGALPGRGGVVPVLRMQFAF